MKIKIYPSTGDCFYITLPENVKDDDDIEDFLEQYINFTEHYEIVE